MRSIGSRTSPDIDSPRRAKSKAWGLRAIIYCASAVLLALAIHMMATYGFNAVVKCEVENYHLLGRSRSVTIKIASINACGF